MLLMESISSTCKFIKGINASRGPCHFFLFIIIIIIISVYSEQNLVGFIAFCSHVVSVFKCGNVFI
jgi:hypothetical protein